MTVSSMMVLLMDIYFLGTRNRIVAFRGKVFNSGIALLGAAIRVTICFERSIGGGAVL